MKFHEEFDWDPKKARTNQKAHGVSFEFAASALADDLVEIFHIEEYDRATASKFPGIRAVFDDNSEC